MWWKIISWHQNVSLQFTESLLKAALTWKALSRNIFQCFPWIQCSVKWHLEDHHCLLSASLAPFQDNLKKTVEFCLLQLLIGKSSQAQEKHNLAGKIHCLFVFSRLFFPFCSFPTVFLFNVVPSEKSTANWRRRKVHAVCFSFFSEAIFRWRKSYVHCKKWGFWTTNNDLVYSCIFS